MDPQFRPLIIAMAFIAVSILIVVGIQLIQMTKRGNPLGALGALSIFLARFTYDINKWVGYTFVGLALLIFTYQYYQIKKG
ncbi:MAG: hypothetical protein QM730_00370 [Anaerolineales bacterium]